MMQTPPLKTLLSEVETTAAHPNQPSSPHGAVKGPSHKKRKTLNLLSGILVIVLALLFTGRKIIRIGESVTATEQPQIIKTVSPEVRARERHVATIMVGDPTRIDAEKFQYIDELNFIAQERYLRFYVRLLLPQDDPNFEPLLAFSPDGVHEIGTPQQFEKYARTYFPQSQELSDK